MEGALVSGMLCIVLLVSVWTGFTASYDAQSRWMATWRTQEQRIADRGRTSVQVSSAQLSTDGSALRVQVLNNGSTAIADLAHADLFVQYTSGGTTRSIWLAYASGGTATGTWVNGGIAPDTYQPGIWNPGETLTMVATLPSAADNNTAGSVQVAAPSGTMASAYISGTRF